MKLSLNHKPVSVILLNWKRPWNLPQVIQSLQAYEFVKQILVFDNSGCFEMDGVEVIQSSVNVCTYGRFLAVQQAQYDIIYTQDDDVVVHNVEALYDRFLGHQERITAGLSGGHYNVEAGRTPWILMGWGSFFLKEWVKVLDRYISEYGEDTVLHRKADRIFTALHGKHDPVPGSFTRLNNPDGKRSDRDSSSLWLKSDHGRLTMESIARVKYINEKCALHTAETE